MNSQTIPKQVINNNTNIIIDESQNAIFKSLKLKRILDNEINSSLSSKKDNTFFSTFNTTLMITFFCITTCRTFARDLTEAAKNQLSPYDNSNYELKNPKFKIQAFERFVVELPLYFLIMITLYLIERICYAQSVNSTRYNLLVIQGFLCIFITVYYFALLHNNNTSVIQLHNKEYLEKDTNIFQYLYYKYIQFTTHLTSFEDDAFIITQNFFNSLLSCICDSFYPALITLFWSYFNEIKNKYKLDNEISNKKTSAILTMSAASSFFSLLFAIGIICGLCSAKNIALFNIRVLMLLNFIIFASILFIIPLIENVLYDQLYENLIKYNYVTKKLKLSLTQKHYIVDSIYGMNSANESEQNIKSKLHKSLDIKVILGNSILINITIINLAYFLFSTFIKSAPSYLCDTWIKSYNRTTVAQCEKNPVNTPMDYILSWVLRSNERGFFKNNVQYLLMAITNIGTIISMKILSWLISKQSSLKKASIIGIIMISCILLLETGSTILISYKLININAFITMAIFFIDGLNRGIKYQSIDLLLILGYNSHSIPDGNRKSCRKSIDGHTNRISKSLLTFLATQLAEKINYGPTEGYTEKELDNINKQSGIGNLIIGIFVVASMCYSIIRVNNLIDAENENKSQFNVESSKYKNKK